MIEKIAEMIKECNRIVFFGGAGVSTESGVKDYRSQDGLYNTVKEYGVPPEEILSHDFFFQNTETFYDLDHEEEFEFDFADIERYIYNVLICPPTA